MLVAAVLNVGICQPHMSLHSRCELVILAKSKFVDLEMKI